jgi:hypothetical protein
VLETSSGWAFGNEDVEESGIIEFIITEERGSKKTEAEGVDL